MKLSKLSFTLFLLLAYGFLMLPFVVVLGASLNAADMLDFPPQGLSLRWYQSFFASAPFIASLVNSVIVGLGAALCSGIIGTLAALYYVRYMQKRKEAFRLAVMSPLVLPEILTAIALLFLFNQFIGVQVSLVPLIIGHTVICLPFVFLSVSSALYNLPPGVEEAAKTLGANDFKTFRRVTLPLIKSGVVTGSLLAFITSFDNVNISLMLKPRGESTLPIQLMDYLQYNFDATAAAASAVSAIVTLALVAIIDRLYGLRTVRF